MLCYVVLCCIVVLCCCVVYMYINVLSCVIVLCFIQIEVLSNCSRGDEIFSTEVHTGQCKYKVRM